MVWFVILALLIFLAGYLQPWAEYPSQITTAALNKYCAQDLKQQFIQETVLTASGALFLTDQLLNEVEASLSDPRVRLLFLTLRPTLREWIYREITTYNLALTFYLQDRCGKIDYWILCGNKSLSSLSVYPYVSYGWFKIGLKSCDWDKVLKIENNTPVVCFDCGDFYAVSYKEGQALYASKIRGNYTGLSLCLNLSIPSSVNKTLNRYASNISFNVSC